MAPFYRAVNRDLSGWPPDASLRVPLPHSQETDPFSRSFIPQTWPVSLCPPGPHLSITQLCEFQKSRNPISYCVWKLGEQAVKGTGLRSYPGQTKRRNRFLSLSPSSRRCSEGRLAAPQAAGLNLTHALRSRLRNKLGLRIRTFQCQEGKGMHQGDVHRALRLKPRPRHRCTVRPQGSHGSRLTSVRCLMIFLQFTQRATTGPAPHNVHELGRLQSSGPQWLSHSRVTGDSLRTWKTQSPCEYLGPRRGLPATQIHGTNSGVISRSSTPHPAQGGSLIMGNTCNSKVRL